MFKLTITSDRPHLAPSDLEAQLSASGDSHNGDTNNRHVVGTVRWTLPSSCGSRLRPSSSGFFNEEREREREGGRESYVQRSMVLPSHVAHASAERFREQESAGVERRYGAIGAFDYQMDVNTWRSASKSEFMYVSGWQFN